MTAVMSIDVESRSTIDLKKQGSHVYWGDPTTSLLCAAWAIDDSHVRSWVPGEPCPPEVVDHIRSGGLVSGWNVSFEALAFRAALAPRFGWPLPDPRQFDDTAAMAAAMSLPRGLDEAAEAIQLGIRKDADGYRVMLAMSKPRKRREDEPPGVYWDEDPVKFARLLAYNKQDVVLERALRKTLMPLSAHEMELYRLDQKINQRGVMLDLALVDKLQQITSDEQQRLNEAMRDATGGAIHTTNQTVAICKWLSEHGAETDSVAKAVVTDLLERPLPEPAKRVLELRREAAKSSTGKLQAASRCVCSDGRARGMLLFLGADSGRWAGKLLQPHNFPRPSGLVKDPEIALPWLMTGSAAAVDFAYGWPLRAVADALRQIIVAAPGHDLVAADFSSIESRLLGWAAGEDWKVAAYRAQDAGQGPGIYEINAARIFDVAVEEIGDDDPRRQVGKTAELSMGYAGGVTALTKMARGYNVRMADALPALMKSAPDERIEAAERRYKDCLKRSDSSTDVLTEESWMATELVKLAWRAANPSTAAFWKTLATAALAAVDQPGLQVDAGKTSFRAARSVLWQRLPSGRVLAYPDPRAALLEVPWADMSLPPVQRERRRTVTALTIEGKKLVRRPLYGGLLTAMTIQGSARDLLADAMLRVEAAGYPLVLTVHDEAIAEVPESFGSLEEFRRIVERSEPWAAGLPVMSKGYRAKRFRKG